MVTQANRERLLAAIKQTCDVAGNTVLTFMSPDKKHGLACALTMELLQEMPDALSACRELLVREVNDKTPPLIENSGVIFTSFPVISISPKNTP